MADRFPLILNTSANQIQEIASGDTLDLSGSNIKGVGIITATNISGNIIAGAGSSNIVAGIITATQIDLNGDIDVDGHTNLDNVSVGGATTTTGILNITANTGSTNTTSGALRVAGGAGIQGSVNIGESVNIDVDLDVDGHTNLDNVSVGGATTMSGNLTISNAAPTITLTDSDADDYALQVNGGTFIIHDTTAGATRLSITDAGNVDINGDLDVDGHTNLDNVNVVGVLTVTGAVNASHSTFGNLNTTGITIENTNASIIFNDTNNNPDYWAKADSGIFEIVQYNNGGSNIQAVKINTDGHIDIATNVDFAAGIDVTGNITATGNVSVGGVLTYEDVTNVDSVGIVTARSGLRVTGGTSNFSGASHFVGVANFNETIVGTARTAIKLTCTDESTDTTTYPLFVAATTGDQFPKTGTNLSFNSANGTLTATTFSGSGASLTNLPAAQLSGTAAAINGSNITNVNAASVGGIAAGSFLRSDATDTASGAITFTSGALQLSSHYFQGYYSGTTNYIHLYPYNTTSGNASVTNIRAFNGSSADTFQITGGSATGLKWRGYNIWTAENDGSGSTLDADTVDGIQGSNIMTLSGTQTIAGTKTFNCSGYDVQLDYDNNRTLVSILRSTTEKVRLHTSGDTILVETFNSGVIRWKSGLVPNADDTYDLGATGTRWRNLYVNDLQLSNESKKDKGGNDVDGTWGDWTLQEGDENIFMLNNRTGKKYKMNLTEVE